MKTKTQFVLYTGRGFLSGNAFLVRTDVLSGEFFATDTLEEARKMTLPSAERMEKVLAQMTDYGVASWEPMEVSEARARQLDEAHAILAAERRFGGCIPKLVEAARTAIATN